MIWDGLSSSIARYSVGSLRSYLAVADYWHIDTGGKDASPDGGLLPRMHPGHSITVYVTVPSVDKAVVKVQKLSGTVCKPKIAK